MTSECVTVKVKLGGAALPAHDLMQLERRLIGARSLIQATEKTLKETVVVVSPNLRKDGDERRDHILNDGMVSKHTQLSWYIVEDVLAVYYRLSTLIEEEERQARIRVERFHSSTINQMRRRHNADHLSSAKCVYERSCVEEDAHWALKLVAQEHSDYLFSIKILEEDERQDIARRVGLPMQNSTPLLGWSRTPNTVWQQPELAPWWDHLEGPAGYFWGVSPSGGVEMPQWSHVHWGDNPASGGFQCVPAAVRRVTGFPVLPRGTGRALDSRSGYWKRIYIPTRGLKLKRSTERFSTRPSGVVQQHRDLCAARETWFPPSGLTSVRGRSMSSSFLVPFTLNVRLSVSCSSLHDGLGGLLSLLRADDHSVKAGTMSRDPCADGERQDALRHLLSRDASVLSEIDFRGDIPAIEDFASTIRSVDSFEKGYISLIFREYCKRMGIISEWKASLQAAQRESSFPISGALLDTVIAEEASARAELHTSREHFVEWAKGVAPRWLETARNMGASKKTEDGAAERAQNQLETVIAQQFGFSGNDVVNSGPPSSPRVTGANSDALRRQAIAMIEQEQSLRRQEAKTRVASLLEQEEQLRCQMEERRQKRETEEKRHHQANMEAFCQQLRQEEESFRQRMEARESERLQLLEHIEAEEQWLSQRLADRERQRALEIEAKERAEREQRELYREHVEAEEELLRNRLQQYEASRKMEAEKARQKEKEDREELYEHVLAEEQLIRQRLEQREKEAERRARYELYHAGRADAGLGNTDSTLPEHSFGTQQLVGYQAINNSYTGVGLCGERQAFTSPQGHPHSYHQQVHSLPHVQHYQQQYLPQVITSPAQPSCYPVAPAVPQPATVYSPLTQSVVTPPYNHYVSYHPQGELRSPQPPQMFPGNHPYYLNR